MSTEVHFSRSINKETKYCGLSLIGIIVGGVFGSLTLMNFDLVFALIASTVGFAIGAFMAGAWHKGRVQKWVYWQLPVSKLSGNKYLPKSYLRTFM
jgi:hypothetical protein